MRRSVFAVAAASAFAAVFAFALPMTSSAQMAPGARSVGMGGGGMVFATGVDAIEWNPANLGWSDGWNVSVFELGIATMSSGATFTPAWSERVSLGVEQKLPILTLRAGAAVGSDDLTALTGGLGLGIGPVHLEASAGRFSAEGALVSKEGYYGTFALQLKGGGL